MLPGVCGKGTFCIVERKSSSTLSNNLANCNALHRVWLLEERSIHSKSGMVHGTVAGGASSLKIAPARTISAQTLYMLCKKPKTQLISDLGVTTATRAFA